MTQEQSEKDESLGRTIGGAIGGAIEGAIDTAAGSVTGLGRLLTGAFRLPGLTGRHRSIHHTRPGSAAGIEHAPRIDELPDAGAVRIRCVDYGPDLLRQRDIDDVDALNSEDRGGPAAVRWIQVAGLHPYVINRLRERMGFHTLAAEDVLNVPQRPRAEAYEDHVFVVVRLFGEADGTGGMPSQQLSMFVRRELVVTFQETSGDVWAPILKRLERDGSQIRNNDGTYLAYALLDTVVDHVFPVLEGYAEKLDSLEDAISAHPSSEQLQRVHLIRRELAVLRRVLWPMREVVTELRRPEQSLVSPLARDYLVDVADHCAQALDMVETFRDLGAGLTDLYLSMNAHRTNEVMQMLTIIATIFIPITFLAGIYGMNFEYLPELKWRHGYLAFWGVCVTIVGSLLWYFRRRGWLGR